MCSLTIINRLKRSSVAVSVLSFGSLFSSTFLFDSVELWHCCHPGNSLPHLWGTKIRPHIAANSHNLNWQIPVHKHDTWPHNHYFAGCQYWHRYECGTACVLKLLNIQQWLDLIQRQNRSISMIHLCESLCKKEKQNENWWVKDLP